MKDGHSISNLSGQLKHVPNLVLPPCAIHLYKIRWVYLPGSSSDDWYVDIKSQLQIHCSMLILSCFHNNSHRVFTKNTTHIQFDITLFSYFDHFSMKSQGGLKHAIAP